MAGDWIKICKETPFKPEILVIATKLNIHPDIAFARCFQLWSWFDSNTKDGVTSGVTKITLDALLNRDGLCDALVSVGWLGENEGCNLYLPNFDRHNSETAKTRALGSKRQSKYRDKSNANNNATVTMEALPEKRREDKRKDIPQKQRANRADVFPEIQNRKIVDDWLAIRKLKKLAVTETALEGFADEVIKAGFTVEQALIKCCHEGWGGFKAKWIVDGKTNEPKKAWE